MSPDVDLPEGVERFLEEHIESYEQLEVLLLLLSQPEHAWDVQSVAAATHIREDQVGEVLHFLLRKQLLQVLQTQQLSFRYGPSSPHADAMVRALAASFEDKKLDVMRAMTQNAMERLRASAASTFTDALLIGRKRDGT